MSFELRLELQTMPSNGEIRRLSYTLMEHRRNIFNQSPKLLHEGKSHSMHKEPIHPEYDHQPCSIYQSKRLPACISSARSTYLSSQFPNPSQSPISP
ncbi:hypothetical protein DM02DRAFT_59746 [Periconia macrospinosa]|uniref:Uncharacterized protein n=1 Tax=Periconia macrospinosa TaxID=97972 RepID=A0A2V1DLS3_9PLEO|nr:hypothetical protein DM02DRAFT_59746 [Periconia macrospinosa]